MNKLKIWSPITPFWPDNWPLPDDWDVSFDDNALDLYETDNDVIVEVKCPGFDSNDIEVTLESGVLSIKGNVEEVEEEEKKKKKYFRKEISRKSFARSVTLPVPVKSEQVDATFKNGILRLVMPKAEEAKPKQIKISIK